MDCVPGQHLREALDACSQENAQLRASMQSNGLLSAMSHSDTEPSESNTVAAAMASRVDPPKAVSTSRATVVLDQYSAIPDQESLQASAAALPAVSIARQDTEPSTSTAVAAATTFSEPAAPCQPAAGPTSGATAVDQRSVNAASVTVTPGAPIAQTTMAKAATDASNRPPSVRVQDEASDLLVPVPVLGATEVMPVHPPEPLPATVSSNTVRPENARGGSATSVAAGNASSHPPVVYSATSIGQSDQVEHVLVPQAAQDASQQQDVPLPPPADQMPSHRELQQGVVEHEQASVPPNKFSDALSAALSAELEATEDDVIDPAHAIQGAISNLAGGLQGLWRR